LAFEGVNSAIVNPNFLSGQSESLGVSSVIGNTTTTSTTPFDRAPFDRAPFDRSSPVAVIAQIKKQKQAQGTGDKKSEYESPSKSPLKGEVLVRELEAPKTRTVLEVAKAVEFGEAVSNWSTHNYKLVSINPRQISERICLECPQKLNMIQSTSSRNLLRRACQ